MCYTPIEVREVQKYTTAQRLKQIMFERNLKQVDIINAAKPYCDKFKVKLGRNDLSQYVSGKVEPRQNKLYILAKALNIDEAWLMGYDVPMERSAEEKNIYEQDSLIDTVIYSRDGKTITKKLTKEQMDYLDKFINSISDDDCDL